MSEDILKAYEDSYKAFKANMKRLLDSIGDVEVAPDTEATGVEVVVMADHASDAHYLDVAVQNYDACKQELSCINADWIAMLQEVAKLSDAMGLDDGDWADADDDILLEQFDPWYVIREAKKRANTPADRDALADALIAWAADEPRVVYPDDMRFEMCPLCKVPERAAYVGGLETDTQIDHAPECLHERAKALRGDE